MLRNHIPHFYWLIILASIVIFGISLWPMPQTSQSMRINQDFLDAQLLEACPLLRQLGNYRFEVKAPEIVWVSTSTPLNVQLSSTNVKLTEEQRQECSLALQASLQISGIAIQPGNEIIAPFSGKPYQTLSFNLVAPARGDTNGELWLHALVKPVLTSQAARLPLFSIPIHVSVRSLFGLPPGWVRYACLFVWVALLGFFIRRRFTRML